MKKYVDFNLVEKKPKTNVYEVIARTNGDILGKIYWYFGWRQYIFEPYAKTIWSRGCLQQIMDFLNKLMEERKKGVYEL